MSTIIVSTAAGKLSKAALRNLTPSGRSDPSMGSVLKERKKEGLVEHIKDALPSIAIGTAVTASVALAGIPLMSAAGIALAAGGTAAADTALEAVMAWKKLQDKRVESAEDKAEHEKNKAAFAKIEKDSAERSAERFRDERDHAVQAAEGLTAERDTARAELDEANTDRTRLQGELGEARNERDQEIAESLRLTIAADDIREELGRARADAHNARMGGVQARNERDNAREERDNARTERYRMEREARHVRLDGVRARMERDSAREERDSVREELNNVQAVSSFLERERDEANTERDHAIGQANNLQQYNDALISRGVRFNGGLFEKEVIKDLIMSESDRVSIRGENFEASELVDMKRFIQERPEEWRTMLPEDVIPMIKRLNRCSGDARNVLFTNGLEAFKNMRGEDVTSSIQNASSDLENGQSVNIEGETFEPYQLVYAKELVRLQANAWKDLSPEQMVKMIKVINKCNEIDRTKIFNNLSDWINGDNKPNHMENILSPDFTTEFYIAAVTNSERRIRQNDGQNIMDRNSPAKNMMEAMIKAVSDSPDTCDPLSGMGNTMNPNMINVTDAEAEENFDKFLEFCKGKLDSEVTEEQARRSREAGDNPPLIHVSKFEKYKIRTALRFFIGKHVVERLEHWELTSMLDDELRDTQNDDLRVKYTKKLLLAFPDITKYRYGRAHDDLKEWNNVEFAKQIGIILKIANNENAQNYLRIKPEQKDIIYDSLLDHLQQATRGYKDTNAGGLSNNDSLKASYEHAYEDIAMHRPSLDGEDPGYPAHLERNDAVDDAGNIKMPERVGEDLYYKFQVNENRKLSIVQAERTDGERCFTHRDLMDKGSCAHGVYNIIGTSLLGELVKQRPAVADWSKDVVGQKIENTLSLIERASEEEKAAILDGPPILTLEDGNYYLKEDAANVLKPFLTDKILQNNPFYNWGQVDNLSDAELSDFKEHVTESRKTVGNALLHEDPDAYHPGFLSPYSIISYNGQVGRNPPLNSTGKIDNFVTWYVRERQASGLPVT